MGLFFRKYFVGVLIWFIYRALSWTWRIDEEESPQMMSDLKNKSPFIMAHWHGDELALVHLTRKYRMATIVSTSKDGDLMNFVIRLFGGRTSRGSSTRGGASALKGLLRLGKEGRNPSLAVDGPKGPIYKVKPGIFEVSRFMKAPIYWCGVSCDRAWRFEKSWNKSYLPKPFSKVNIVWHGPIGPITKDQDARSEELALSLESALRNAQTSTVKKIAAN